MNAHTVSRLLELNLQFYQRFGVDFSATRSRIQPGVRRILERLNGSEVILDLGCGNGNFERELSRRGHRAPVLALDFSLPLLEAAALGPKGPAFVFAQADLAADWGAVIAEKIQTGAFLADGFDLAVAFAVLHHLPGRLLRVDFCCKVAAWLRPGGRFILSAWQFLNSGRLRARIQPWSLVGLSESEVEANDYLLDWRAGGQGLRYVHHFDEDELSALALESGCSVIETFYSDGQGGRLGMYQVWEKYA